MKDIIMFGKKGNFAIQLGLNVNIEKCHLCFWVQDAKLGSFAKGDSLKYSIKAYQIFSGNRYEYYLSIFDAMAPSEIRKYFVDEMFALVKSNKAEKMEEYEKRRKFYLFFGFQFANDGREIILLYKNDDVIFIYSRAKRTDAKKYIVSYNEFSRVFEDYAATVKQIICCENHLFYQGLNLTIYLGLPKTEAGSEVLINSKCR